MYIHRLSHLCHRLQKIYCYWLTAKTSKPLPWLEAVQQRYRTDDILLDPSSAESTISHDYFVFTQVNYVYICLFIVCRSQKTIMARNKNEIIFFQRFFSDSAFETNEPS